MFLPPRPGLASRGPLSQPGFFFRDLFLSEPDCELVSTRRARNQLLWPFSTLVDSPRDQRENGVSRNRGLRSGVRADSRRTRAYLLATMMCYGVTSEARTCLNGRHRYLAFRGQPSGW